MSGDLGQGSSGHGQSCGPPWPSLPQLRVPRISVLVLRLRASLVVPASNGIFNRQHDERRITCKPDSLLGHLYAVKRHHDQHAIPFLTKGATHQLTRTLGLEYALIHGPEALAPRKREALTPGMVRALIRAVDGVRTNLPGFPDSSRGRGAH